MRLKSMFVACLLAATLGRGAGAAVGEFSLFAGRGSGGSMDIDFQKLAARFYLFDGLQDVDAPYELYPFFQRVHSLEVQYNTFSVESAKLRKTVVGGTMYLGDLSLRPAFRHLENGIDANTWKLDVGYHVTDNLHLSLPNAVFGFVNRDAGDVIEPDLSLRSVKAEYVQPLGGEANLFLAGTWVQRSVREAFLLTQYGFAWIDLLSSGTYLEAKIYPRRWFSLGGAAHFNTDGSFDAFNFGGSVWTASNVGITAGLTLHSSDHPELPDVNTMNFGVTARF